MYKNLKRIHLWFSVPLGLVMALICITGFILLFEPSHAGGGERPDFFLNVMRLHRWLFDLPAQKGAMTTGKMIVAISTICMSISVISGIILWGMRARRALSKNLKITFNKGVKEFFISLHTSGGIYVSIFLLLIALTGLTWSFGGYRTFVNSLFGIAKGSHVIYAIHTGAFGGIVTKLIWGISVLTGLTLPLSGYYMWLTRIKRSSRKVR